MKSTVAGPERHTVSSNEKRDFSPYIGRLAHKQKEVNSLILYFRLAFSYHDSIGQAGRACASAFLAAIFRTLLVLPKYL